LVQFFESLVDPIFPLETVLIGKQMCLAAASGKAVIPTTYGCVYQSAASFSHRKSPLRNIRFSPQEKEEIKGHAQQLRWTQRNSASNANIGRFAQSVPCTF
jgi:hypothetical protein